MSWNCGSPEKNKGSLPPCVLVSVEDELPCLDTSCILPLYLRPLTSDLGMLKLHLEDMPHALDMLTSDAQAKHFSTILDAGANIGVSTALLALMFPHARIVAVEASQDNFELLRLNTLSFPNVIPLHLALWDRPGPPLVVTRDSHSSTFATLGVAERRHAARQGTFPLGLATPMDVPTLLSLCGLPSFHLLLIDIQGAEAQVFSGATSPLSVPPGRGEAARDPLWWAHEVHVAVVYTHEATVEGSDQAALGAFPLKHFLIEFGTAAGCSIFRRRDLYESEQRKHMPA